MIVRRLAAGRVVLVDKLLLPLDAVAVHLLEQLLRHLDVCNQTVAPVLGEVLAHHDAQHLEVLGVRRHRVRRHDPPADAELMGQGELVVVAVLLGRQAEGDEREALAGLLGHEDEAEGLEGVGEVVGGAREVAHDGAVPLLAESDELVVLANDLAGTLAEVQGERSLVSAEVVNVEYELLRKVLGTPPDNPADTGVDEAVLS